jgi:Uma2 family endonuclease
MATVTEPLLTAEEYARLPDRGVPTELVRGKIIEMPPPYPYHGLVCLKVGRLVADFVEGHDLGYVVSNDAGVITERGPDTVRGADISFYSYERVPKGQFPRGRYLSVAPELVFEIRSPSDRLPAVLNKIAEYLLAGVLVVCVVDTENQSVQIYQGNELPRTLEGDDELTFPDLLGDFRIAVKQLFP